MGREPVDCRMAVSSGSCAQHSTHCSHTQLLAGLGRKMLLSCQKTASDWVAATEAHQPSAKQHQNTCLVSSVPFVGQWGAKWELLRTAALSDEEQSVFLCRQNGLSLLNACNWACGGLGGRFPPVGGRDILASNVTSHFFILATYKRRPCTGGCWDHRPSP